MTEGKDPEPSQDIDSAAFEEAFRRLGEVAASLEEGGLTLAEATQRYELGMNLVRHCNQLLDEAQLKITTLKDAYASQNAVSEPWENIASASPGEAEFEDGFDLSYPPKSPLS